MDSSNILVRLSDVLKKGITGAIILPSNPSPDAIAAGTSLYLALHKMGKSVNIACSSKTDVNVTAADKIQTQLSSNGDNLVVSFPYTDGAIDKVDYNIQGNNFNLIVTPRQGYPKLDPNQVKYSYSGGMLDFIITIDSPTLNNLGTLYTDNEKQFHGKDIINIDRHLTNAFYGTVNYVNKTISSVSELILKLLQNLGVEIDRDIATNIYAGIAAATNNFTSYSVTADTFENVATLLRLGAIKKTIRKPTQANPFQPNGMTTSTMAGEPMNQFPINNSQPVVRNYGKSFNNQEFQKIKPIEHVEKEPAPDQVQTPQDWLKPKIFRGGGGLI